MPLNLAKFRLPQNHLWCAFQSLWGGMLYEMSRIEETTTRLPLHGAMHFLKSQAVLQLKVANRSSLIRAKLPILLMDSNICA